MTNGKAWSLKKLNDGKLKILIYVTWNRKETEKEKFHTLTKQHPWQVRAAGICQRDAREEIQAGIHTERHRGVNEETHGPVHTHIYYPKLNVSFLLMNLDTNVSDEKLSHALTLHAQAFIQHADDDSVKKIPTDLFPQLGIPTVWMIYTATWKKKTKKKKKKLKELSDLGRKTDTQRTCYYCYLVFMRSIPLHKSKHLTIQCIIQWKFLPDQRNKTTVFKIWTLFCSYYSKCPKYYLS